MFRRIFLYGMLILVVAAAAVLSVSAVFSSEGTRRGSLAPMARYLAEALEPLLDAPEALTKELAHAAAGTPFQLTIYRLDGTLLGSTVDPPLRPLKTREFALLERESGQLAGRFAPVVSRMEQDGQVVGYLLLKLRPLQPPWGRILTTVGLILVAMLLISIPIAGSITAPIERLMESVQRLGAGDLSARTGLRGPDEVARLGHAFDVMAERLQTLIRREQQLLADVSHELRTPLARIRIALEIAAEGDAETARRGLDEIGHDLAELERLIEDVLVTAREALADGRTAEPGMGRLEATDPAELLEEAARRFRHQFPDRELEVELAPALPRIEAQPKLLRRAVDNLLDNARKYSDAVVRLRAFAVEEGLRVEVIDRGIGIAPPDQARLFTPFFRTDISRTRGTGGVGMGLALTRRIIEDHGGQVGVSSAEGQGSTFRFTLPVLGPEGAADGSPGREKGPGTA